MFPASTRILVVDDSSAMRQVVRTKLSDLGFSAFYEAEAGKAGLDLLYQQLAIEEPISLVLSDWNMPGGMNGYQFLQKVRTAPQFHQLPFVMVTAEGEEKDVLNALKAGASAYLTKPFTTEDLRRKLIAAWKHHHPDDLQTP